MIMKTIWRALVLPFVFTTALLAQTNPDWHRSFPAFKIAGNLYYVGTADLAVRALGATRFKDTKATRKSRSTKSGLSRR